MGTLNIDRYHAAMGDASFKYASRLHNRRLSEAQATVYVTQRKLRFTPCLGHERLVRLLIDSQIDRPRLRFLEQDRGGLQLFAKAIEDMQFLGAMRAVDIATYAFIGGFNDTSNMEAAHRLDIPAVGTEAHYWQQSYIEFMYEPEIEPRTRKPKHFEQVAFERWLDANPNGTTLLLDTIDVYMGAVHAVMAATSTEARRRAFKGFRVDSGDLAELGQWCLRFFEANGLHDLRPNLTGDLDVEKVRLILSEFPEAAGFGIGTKLSSEVKAVAGVIFKQCLIEGLPTLKASNSVDKTTLPGRLQLFRGIDDKGNFVGDVTGLDDEEIEISGAERVERLLHPFWENGQHTLIPSIVKQKAFVSEQRRLFTDIDNYPVSLSDKLRKLRDDLTSKMRADNSGWQEILKVPEEVVNQVPQAK